MIGRLNDRKIFLIATPDAETCKNFEKILTRGFQGLTFFFAHDGQEAWAKIENVPPHVLILTAGLQKIDSYRLVQNVLKSKKCDELAVIILGEPPDQEVFVDEVITGRVQFLGKTIDSEKLHKAATKALNYVSAHESVQFHLRFLATGEQLLQQGEKAEKVYLLKSGRLEASSTKDKKKVVFGTIEPGEFVGEMAYINGETRSANVAALSNCELIEIPIDQMDYFLYQKPSWSRALLATLSKRIKRANQQQTENN